MPLPGGLTTITVTGTYTNPDGSAATGNVVFTPTVAVTDATGKVIIPAASVTAGIANGTFSMILPCTDNAGLSPSGWQWNVAVNVTGITGAQATFTVNLPSTLGASVDISALTPVAGVNPGPVSLLNANNTWTGTNTFQGSVSVPSTSILGRLLTDRGSITASTAYNPGDMVGYQGQRVLITQAVTSGTWPNWYTPPTLAAGTYIPITSQAVYYAADWGVVADGVTDNGPALNRALQFMSQGINSGGFLVLPDGYTTAGRVVGVSSTVIIPPGCYIVGSGIETSCIRANANMNADVIQFQTFNSASQATIISAATGAATSAGSLRNAFYAGLMNLCVHGNKSNQGTSQYNYGVNMTTNPVNTTAGTDPDFDPYNVLFNVEIRTCTGDGFFHSGRSGLRLNNVLCRYNDGWGYSLSFDTLVTGCNAGQNGLGGFYVPHSSCSGAASKSYNNGLATQWVSGSNYTVRQVVMYSGGLYRAINALTNDTVPPASDAVNWAHLTGATAPQYWGYAYVFDTVNEESWVACDSQENAAGDYYLHNSTNMAIQGVSSQTAWQATSNPNNYSSVTLDGSSGCDVNVAYSNLNSLAYVLRILGTSVRNDVRMTGDTTYAAILSPDTVTLVGSGNSAKVNGASLSGDVAAVFSATGITGATAASRYVGATASGSPLSGTFAVGDFVVDESGRIWVCTAAGSPGNWISTAGSAQTQVFTISGTWTMPVNATSVMVWGMSAGGGGGSGASLASGTASSGGGAGSSGLVGMGIFPASLLPASVAVSVGSAGGTGGLSVTSGNGNGGSSGGGTGFGAYLRITGGPGGNGGGTTAASGGNGTSGTQCGASGGAGTLGGTGGSGNQTTNSGGWGSGGGGGGGGGISATPAAFNGGLGGNGVAGTHGTGGVVGGALPTADTATTFTGAGGSGGGAASITGTAQDGAAGVAYGAGGGGGGAALSGSASGNGGAGGPGIVIVTTYF